VAALTTDPIQRSLENLGTPLADVTFCVVDLETTGLSASECSITEIGDADPVVQATAGGHPLIRHRRRWWIPLAVCADECTPSPAPYASSA
jgi:hypothetical protein